MPARRTKAPANVCERLTFRVRQLPPTGRRTRVTAYDARDRVVGEITISDFSGRPKVVVTEVDKRVRRCGVGTRLYEHAAQVACERHSKPLESDDLRSGYAEAFWQKQVARGRAYCAARTEDRSAGEPFTEPVEGRSGCAYYRLRGCDVTELRAARRPRRRR